MIQSNQNRLPCLNCAYLYKMHTATAPPQPCPTKRAILRTLWYFEIFQHPLTTSEIIRFSNSDSLSQSMETVSDKLQELIAEGQVYQFDQYFQTQNTPNWVHRRIDHNKRADKTLPIARRMARLIGAFPFVRAVFVSGSLSKHCMAPDSDVDFFIITAPGRLWLTRTLLVVFKKLFLFNSHKYFCVNYFVDTEHLEIEEKNLFTAVETVTLLPLFGRQWYEAFCQANQWAWSDFPNLRQRPNEQTTSGHPSFFKKSLEIILNSPPGNWLDLLAMRFTVWFWRKKFRNLSELHFDHALKSRRYVSKHHPLQFQKKVLDAFAERLEQREQWQ